MRRSATPSALAAAAVLAMVAAGCGSGGHTTTTAPPQPAKAPTTLHIYASLPLSGPQAGAAESVLHGIKLALSQLPKSKDGRRPMAGRYRLTFTSLNDASPRTHRWSATLAAKNARKAATDKAVALYIGDYDSGASKISAPILNEAQVPQISPASTDTSLTNVPGTADAARYRPAGTVTFMRIVPADDVEARADLVALHDRGCSTTVIAGDQEGQALLGEMRGGAHLYGVKLVTVGPNALVNARTPGQRTTYAANASNLNGCFFYAGVPSGASVDLTEDVRTKLPSNHAVLASSSMCGASWARAVGRQTTTSSGVAVGVPHPGPATTPASTTTTSTGTTTTPAQPPSTGFWCTSPTPNPNGTAAARSFVNAFHREFGHDPDLPAAFGYEAMNVGIRAIRQLGSLADDRDQLLEAMTGMSVASSPIGAFSFDLQGSTTSLSYSLYTVKPGGKLSFASPLPTIHATG